MRLLVLHHIAVRSHLLGWSPGPCPFQRHTDDT